MPLPKFVYVYEENNDDGTKFLVITSDSGEHEGLVGIYDLRESLYVRYKTQFRRSKSRKWFDL